MNTNTKYFLQGDIDHTTCPLAVVWLLVSNIFLGIYLTILVQIYHTCPLAVDSCPLAEYLFQIFLGLLVIISAPLAVS